MTRLLPDEELTVSTYNKIAQVWAKNHHTLGFWAKEMHRFKELLPVGVVIDVGAGGARDAVSLLQLGYQYVGTDISDGLLAIARKELPNQSFIKQSIYELNFPAGENFDGFWCSAVLLHVPKIRVGEALRSIRSVTKPKGIGFISIKDGKGERMEIEKWENGETHSRLFSYWSKPGFTKVLKSNGYEVIDYWYRPDSQRTRWHCFFVRVQP